MPEQPEWDALRKSPRDVASDLQSHTQPRIARDATPRRCANRTLPCYTPRQEPTQPEEPMAKAYWIACYRSISNPDALAAYAKLAGPAIAAGGGRFLARGGTAKTYEAGIAQRT